MTSQFLLLGISATKTPVCKGAYLNLEIDVPFNYTHE